MTVCPRCGDVVARGQEYCVECGARLPGGGPVGAVEDPGRGWARRAFLALVVAVAGGAAAVAAGGGDGGSSALLTATGGFASVPTSETLGAPGEAGRAGVGGWPSGKSGWTIVLASLPQTGGRAAAAVRAQRARKAGLAGTGILDSSAYASLHPGYWIVYSGVYASQAEATSALEPARAFAGSASVRQIVP